MLGFCPLISAFDRSGKFGRSRRKDLGPSLCKDVCPFSCLNRCLGNGRWAAWRSGYSLLSSGFRVKPSSGERSSAVSVFWGEKAMRYNNNCESVQSCQCPRLQLPAGDGCRARTAWQHADPRLLSETHSIYDWYFLGCFWVLHLTHTETHLVFSRVRWLQLCTAATESDSGA